MKKGRLVRDDDGWQTVSTEPHFADAHLKVAIAEVRTPTRPKPRKWTVVHRKAAVIVAPMTEKGKLLLIRQERVPIRATIWEMPAGQIDNANADESEIKKVALKELREETGYELAPKGELVALGHYFSSPGFTDECGYLFLARPVMRSADGDAQEDAESIIDCRAFTIQQIRQMIAENEIRDANTLGICARLASRGVISLQPA